MAAASDAFVRIAAGPGVLVVEATPTGEVVGRWGDEAGAVDEPWAKEWDEKKKGAEEVAMRIQSRKEARMLLKQQLRQSNLLDGANPEQAAAIQCTEGPLGVFAGAGSGKTRVLCTRIAYLVSKGISPQRILAVTFSKKAAVEMEDRVKQMGVLDARVGTWHSLAYEILRKEGLIDGWKTDDTDRAKYVLKDVIGYKGMNWKDADIGVVTSFISFCKSQLWVPGSVGARDHAQGESRLVEAYRRYENELVDKRLLTFDCMLVKAWAFLRKSEENRARWASKWDYVLQDEAQDANPAQMEIAEMLARDHRNYMVVGDPAQSIYGFRGSRPEYVTEFGQSWRGATIINMNRNYRCGSKIVAVANEAIRPAKHRLPVDLIAEGNWEGGVSYWREDNLDEEATRIVSIVQDNFKVGKKLEDHTVLFRTNAQSRAMEEAFLAAQVPYVVVGGTNFYERKEVKDLLAYLRLSLGREIEDNLRRCINAPFRFIGTTTVDKILASLQSVGGKDIHLAIARTQGLQSRQIQTLNQWLGVLRGVQDGGSVGSVIDRLERSTGYCEWLKKDQGDESVENSHVANVKELIRVGEKFTSIEAFVDFIDDTIRKSQKKDDGKGRVLLMSIHRAKGLEWPYVFVAGCSEGILPHPRGDEDEERRLFYVAVTRAAQHCYLTSPSVIAMRSGVKEVAPSRYVDEVMSIIGSAS